MNVFKTVKLKKILKILLFFIILTLLLLLSKQNFESVKYSTNLFLSSVLPSLFPFILFTEIINKSDIIHLLTKIFGKPISKIFNIKKEGSIAVIIGFLCGFPMGAKTVNDLYQKGLITKKDAYILMSFVNNCNPAFLISTIGIGVFCNINIGYILLVSHILSSLLIGFMYSKRYSNKNIIHEENDFLNTFNKKSDRNKEKYTFFETLKLSIINTFKTLANILGFIIIFNLLYNVITILLPNISPIYLNILSGIFEVTKGSFDIYNISPTLLDLNAKIVLISIILGFSGFCIICQIYSTLNDIKYNLKKLVLFKTMHGILSGIITYIILKVTNFTDNTSLVFSNTETNLENTYYIENMKEAYLVSTTCIIAILIVYYIIHNIKLKKQT